jgi:ElaB/YqjD/DUF883 family membrane-anchored ribosome-binding protein
MAHRDLDKALASLHRDLERVQKDLATLARDGGKAAKQAGTTAHEAGDAAYRTLETGAHAMVDAAKDVGSSAIAGGEHVLSSVEEHIKAHPLAMVAAAVGTGVAIGWLIHRPR